MLDIDHFKQVNDSYGHPAGDAVITALAQVLRETLREVDVIGRIGGEEFVALLPETDRDLAMRTAERLRSSLYAHRHPVTTPAINVSVSIGVATRIEDEPSLERMLLRADAALYAAKDAGRNCVKLAE